MEEQLSTGGFDVKGPGFIHVAAALVTEHCLYASALVLNQDFANSFPILDSSALYQSTCVVHITFVLR